MQTAIGGFKDRFNALLTNNTVEELAIKYLLVEEFVTQNESRFKEFQNNLLNRILIEEIV